jgi:hypothetical protein
MGYLLVLIYISLMINDVQQLYMCLFHICICLEKCLLKSSPHNTIAMNLECLPKDPCVNGLWPKIALLRSNKNCKRWGLVGGFKLLEAWPLRDYRTLALFLSHPDMK